MAQSKSKPSKRRDSSETQPSWESSSAENAALNPLLAAISSAAVAPFQAALDNFRISVVALLSTCRLIIQLGLIAHIILIHVQRLTPDFRTALVALRSNFRLIVLLGLIATLSAFSVLHFGLLDYRDRQCKTHPKHAATAELVKTAHQFSTAVRFDEECAMHNAKITSLRMMAPCKRSELQI
jgi:hypothetical protein